MLLFSRKSRRRGLVGILILFWSWPAGADPRPPAPGNAWNPATRAASVPGPALAQPPSEICTRASCAPRSGDSPWSLAGFGLAALASIRLGRRSTSPQSRPNSASG